MTKIKNTKKGMAKKTLSMSLVVAMLATSNVPVWAAEFSDGSDADVAVTTEAPAVDTADEFSDNETEAPVVADDTTDVPTAQVAEGYHVNTNMKLKDSDWASKLSFEKGENVATTENEKFEIIDNKTDLSKAATKVELYSGDSKIDEATIDGTKITTVKGAIESLTPGFDAYKNAKTITVKVYVGNDVVYEDSATLTAVDVNNGCTITVANDTVNYNGKIQAPTVTIAKGSASVAGIVSFEDVTYAKDAGTYKYSVEGDTATGFTGKIPVSKSFKINKVDPSSKNMSVVISGSTTYNGANTKPTVVVTDLLSGDVLPAELYKVKVSNTAAGTYNKSNVTITLNASAKIGDKTVTNNFNAGDVQNLATGSYTVSALDLSKLGEKYTIEAAPKVVNEKIGWADLTLTDNTTGKVVNYKNVLPYNDLTILTSDNTAIGTGKFVIKAKTATKNISGEYTGNFEVVGSVINKDSVSFAAGTKVGTTTYTKKTSLTTADANITKVLSNISYTGSAVEPLKEAFGSLVLTTSNTKEDKALVEGTDYDVIYTDNTDSKDVSKKDSTVTLQFKGEYAGKISYTFDIKQATAYVVGNNIEFVEGKTSYDVSAKVYTKEGTVETAVPEKEYVVETTSKGSTIGTYAKGRVVFENKNYTIYGGSSTSDGRWYKAVNSKVVAKDLKNCTATVDGEYVYTGEAISPKLIVKDGDKVLVEGTDYTVIAKTGTNVGPAHITIEGKGVYTGTLIIDYTIKKANLSTAKVLNKNGKTVYDNPYSGITVKPDVTQVKIGNTILTPYDAVTKTGDYILTWDENAIEVGTYNFTITAVPTSAKVEGEFKGTYKVTPNKLKGCFATKVGLKKVSGVLDTNTTGANYTGSEIKLENFKTKYVLIDSKNNVLTEGKDYRLVYENNIDAGKATVTAYGLGNYAAVDKNGKELPITAMNYYIGGKGVITANDIKKVSDVEYAGGLAVEPQVVILNAKGEKLVQGVDYTVTTNVVNVGSYKGNYVTITGKGAYLTGTSTTVRENSKITASTALTWKVTKKDLANTTVSVDKNNNVTVVNGTVIVPSSEYDVKFSEDGKKVTVTAKADSKNYTGSKELAAEVAKVGAPIISNVKVAGNNATVILSDEAEGASGYDYVISTSKDPSDKDARIDVVKNQVQTTANFKYVPQGTYYAYCHAWTRDENGKKVFGEWSNSYAFSVTAITPDTPEILSVQTKGSTITVTYKESANSTGYDVVLGKGSKKEHGETRPYQYGNYKKLNVKPGVCKAVFKNVPAGTYYAGVHSWNRTASENDNKVFSKWSNLETAKVK